MNLNDPRRAKDELERAIQGGQPDQIARAAMYHLWPLLTAHTELLIATVGNLGMAQLERYPALRICHPMTAVRARTVHPFKPLMYPDEARGLSPEELDFVLLTQIIAFRTSGDVPGALLYAKRLEERLQSVRVESRDRLDGPLWFFHHQIGSTMLAAGDSSAALLQFATARQLGRLSAQPDAERVALGSIALSHAVRGALSDAERALADARCLPVPTYAHVSSALSTEAAAAALIAVDRMSGGVDESLAELVPYDAIELTWPFALLARTRALLARQQPEDALEAVRLADDWHPVQPGSFAFDVIGAGLVDALVAMGDLAFARRVAQERAPGGVLTRLAVVHLSLREANVDAAAQGLRSLARDQTLGPAQRAECVLLSGWLELARTEELGRDTAMQIFRVVRRPDHRRLVPTLPRQLVEQVRLRLPAEFTEELDAATAGLVHLEMESRPVLTAGELRILHALLEHKSTAAMASNFHVSPNTIKSQLRSLYRKLGCRTRDEAIRIAAQKNLLAP